MLKLTLRVDFKDKQRMSEEPMGDFFEFETIEDFIKFNREELSILSDLCPESKEFADAVDKKLLNREFYIEPYTDDMSFIVVKDI